MKTSRWIIPQRRNDIQQGNENYLPKEETPNHLSKEERQQEYEDYLPEEEIQQGHYVREIRIDHEGRRDKDNKVLMISVEAEHGYEDNGVHIRPDSEDERLEHHYEAWLWIGMMEFVDMPGRSIHVSISRLWTFHPKQVIEGFRGLFCASKLGLPNIWIGEHFCMATDPLREKIT